MKVKTVHERMKKSAFIGVGGCGINMLKSWSKHLPSEICRIVINRGEHELKRSSGMNIFILNKRSTVSGIEKIYMVAGERQIQTAMQQHMIELTDILKDHQTVVLLAGLGGQTGTWATQLLCNHLVSIGKRVVTVLVMPFSFERKRVELAEQSLAGFDGSAHRVLCFNDYLIRHTPEDTSLEAGFEFMNEKAFDLLSFPD